MAKKWKKWRKRTLIIFQFYMKICPPTFSGLRKWHYLQKFPWEKVATHLKIFLQVIQNFWHGQNALSKNTKKKVQGLLEPKPKSQKNGKGEISPPLTPNFYHLNFRILYAKKKKNLNVVQSTVTIRIILHVWSNAGIRDAIKKCKLCHIRWH